MPTRAGWGVLVASIVLLLAGRVAGGLELMVPGAAGVIAVVGAVLIRRLRPSRIAIAKQLSPPRVPAGEPARIDIEIRNRSKLRSPLLRVHDAVTGTRGVQLSIAPLPPDGSTRGAYRLPTTRRGVIELGPTRIDDVDPLGLARRTHVLDSTVRLVVHPLIEAIPVRRVPAGDDPLLGEELRRSLGLSDEEFDDGGPDGGDSAVVGNRIEKNGFQGISNSATDTAITGNICKKNNGKLGPDIAGLGDGSGSVSEFSGNPGTGGSDVEDRLNTAQD